MRPAAKVLAAWRSSVQKFAADNFDFIPDPWQRDAMRAWAVTNGAQLHEPERQAA